MRLLMVNEVDTMAGILIPCEVRYVAESFTATGTTPHGVRSGQPLQGTDCGKPKTAWTNPPNGRIRVTTPTRARPVAKIRS